MDALLPTIVAALADERKDVAIRVVQTISDFGRPKFGVPELLAWMKQPESWKRTIGASVLSKIATDDPEVLRAVLTELEQGKADPNDSYSSVRIIEAVGRFGPKAKPAVEKLAALVKNSRAHEDRDICRNIHDAAVRALEQIGPDAKAAVPILLGCLELKIFLEEPGDDYYIGYRPTLLLALDKIDPKVAEKARADDKRRYEAYDQLLREKNPLPPKKNPLP